MWWQNRTVGGSGSSRDPSSMCYGHTEGLKVVGPGKTEPGREGPSQGSMTLPVFNHSVLADNCHHKTTRPNSPASLGRCLSISVPLSRSCPSPSSRQTSMSRAPLGPYLCPFLRPCSCACTKHLLYTNPYSEYTGPALRAAYGHVGGQMLRIQLRTHIQLVWWHSPLTPALER